MSRVGKRPVVIPQGVQLNMQDQVLSVKGPKGELNRRLNGEVEVTIEDDRIVVKRRNDSKRLRALHGLTRTLIANMVEGVTNGFTKSLDLVGVGYRASKSGNNLVLAVGYSHPVEIVPPEGVEIEVPNPTLIVVRGYDKEAVGQTAADIRAVRPPEPYQGKGIRYTGERVRRKAGKAGKK